MALQIGIIYLQKDKFQMYAPNTRSILEFRFAPQVVSDMDVLNNGLLEEYIKAFVVNSKIAPCSLIVLLANNMSFIKDIVPENVPKNQKGVPGTSPVKPAYENIQQEIEDFLEHVPYDNIVSLLFPLPSGKRIYATNKTLFDSVISGFEELGFTTESVFPALLLGELSTRPVMDAAMVNLVLQKESSYKQYNLKDVPAYQVKQNAHLKEGEVLNEEPDLLDEKRIIQSEKKTNVKRLILLIGVFVILLIILGVVYYETNLSNNPPPKNATSEAETQVVLATTIEPSPMLTITEPSIQTLSVQITNTNTASGEANQLKNNLQVYGFKFINVNSQPHLNYPKTIISFSQNVFPDVRNLIINEVKKNDANILVQNSKTPYDISIVLQKT